MSFQSNLKKPIPEETVRVARAANPKGNPYMAFRDELDRSFKDQDIGDIVQDFGKTSPTSLQLALVTILQFRENLSDYQAADAVRSRITWKYLLGLELTDLWSSLTNLAVLMKAKLCLDWLRQIRV